MTECLRSPCAALTAGVAPSAAEAGGPPTSSGACAQQRGECQQQHHQLEQQKHAAAMQAGFSRSQAAAHSQLDLYSGICLSALLLLALPRSMQREHWRTQLAGFAAEVGLRLVPAYLACIAYDVYLPRRTYIVAACRLAGTLLPTLAVLPPALAVHAAWGGWMHFLLFTRSLGVNTLPFLARLPFKWFAWVQLVGVAAAARLSLSTACASPAFTSPAAQQQFAAVARVAQYLTTFAPIHTPTLQGGGSCLDSSLPGAGACSCEQMAIVCLACVGYAFPLACHFLSEAAAWRSFLRNHCRHPGCEACSAGKGIDLPVLTATVALLFAGFCAVVWQLAAGAFMLSTVQGE